MPVDPTVSILMYFVLPLWLLAGLADWLCHRASNIATTTGAKESLIHLLMFFELGLPLLAALFLDINAGIILLMIVSFLVHEATAIWDVRYATTARTVTPTEQHVHSFLEMLPLTALVCVVSLHWHQFLALFGAGSQPARFDLTWKRSALPVAYIAAVLLAVLCFEFLPYLQELAGGLRSNGGRLVPVKAGHARPGATARR